MKNVYIIYNPETKLTKIGITDNLTRRKRQLECSSGQKLELYYYTDKYNHAKLIENSLHQYFKVNRKEGEYFTTEPEVIKEKLLFIVENLSRTYKIL
jgi:hypothetical protein